MEFMLELYVVNVHMDGYMVFAYYECLSLCISHLLTHGDRMKSNRME